MSGKVATCLRRTVTGASAALALAFACWSIPSPAAAAAPVRHLVVGGFASPSISIVDVTRDGALSVAPGSPFATGGLLSLALGITPDATNVYSAQMGLGAIIGYRIAPDGSLGRIDGGTVMPGLPVAGLAIAPDGSRVFATVGGEVRSYTISPSGALTPTGAPAAKGNAIGLISQLVITPDGRHLVVSNYLSNSVSSFAIGPDARVTPVGEPVATGASPVMPAFTADGRYLYVSNESGDNVSGYAVGGDGSLTPTPGSPYAAPSTPHGATIAPDGRRLYVSGGGVSGAGGNEIAGYRIGADGALTPLPGSPYPGPGSVGRVVLSPDARRLFVVEGVGDFVGAPAAPALPPPTLSVSNGPESSNPVTSQVYTYVVRPDGSLSLSGHPPVDTGLLWSDGSTAFISPNQGPTSALRVVGDERGLTRTFSAEGSNDVDGTIAGYRWDFGDGSQQTTSTPSVTHRFRQPGTWTVTLTVTDDEGCSTEQIYNGTTVVCRGGPQAQATQRLTV